MANVIRALENFSYHSSDFESSSYEEGSFSCRADQSETHTSGLSLAPIKEADATPDTSHTSSRSGEAQLARKETSVVFQLRVVVFLAMIVAAVAVSLSVYFITSNAEREEYQASFTDSAAKVIDSFEDIVVHNLGAIASLGVTFTSYARSHNNTWPFVTMNDFQQRAAATRKLSDAYFLEILPLVTDEDRIEWETYALANKGWLDDGRQYQAELGLGFSKRRIAESPTDDPSPNEDHIFKLDGNREPIPDPGPGPYFPIWQSSPILNSPRDLVNYNLLQFSGYAPYIRQAAQAGEAVIGGLDTAEAGGVSHADLTTSFFATIKSFAAGEPVEYKGDPMSSVYIPVFDSYAANKTTVAVLVAVIQWSAYFEGLLPGNSDTLTVVLKSTCQGAFTYEVSGDEVVFVGQGDLRNKDFSNLVVSTDFASLHGIGDGDYALNEELCSHSLFVYPTKEMYYAYNTRQPIVITFAVLIVFIFTVCMFLLYDRLQENRQKLVLREALRSNAIVASLFPQQIHDRLFAPKEKVEPVQGQSNKLKSFLDGKEDFSTTEDGVMFTTKPIADLFPATTVMFADIVGFTAWSAVREPSEVFTLLETLYKAFDDIATRRKVFKVETVGDCYVAVTGLPDPRKDHAVVMARFAKECLYAMISLTKMLETTLGADTGDLRVRVGLHSGPVTAGVLRGERSRFQLFGDTMNTAARVESTGKPGCIHMSQETADLLKAAGKGHWVAVREDRVYAKGKGEMQTYWLDLGNSSDLLIRSNESMSMLEKSVTNFEAKEEEDEESQAETEVIENTQVLEHANRLSKNQRLIDWNVDILSRLLKQVVARRNCLDKTPGEAGRITQLKTQAGKTVLDEVAEIIELPHFDASATSLQEDPESMVLSDPVTEQLRDFVSSIGALYHDNPFHNFGHASHVTMSVAKLLSRIVAPCDLDLEDGHQASSTLHDHTYGITSDPLTQFACVLSALIHDVDHAGVPNTQLVKENTRIAEYYKGKSVAEQNSVDLAWFLLMDQKYADLRATIYADEAELQRFRQLVVNSVMATDIMDKDLKELRNGRWDKAFKEKSDEGTRTAVNRKATIVIEHLIQASDVSHTMQHWSVYRKWNERLFEEMYQAYREGRAEKDPAENWYKGEMGFFDFYIIPLAKKLKDCGVFGVSSDEYLLYAIMNRREWESKGQAIVAEMMERVKRQWDQRERAKSEQLFV